MVAIRRCAPTFYEVKGSMLIAPHLTKFALLTKSSGGLLYMMLRIIFS